MALPQPSFDGVPLGVICTVRTWANPVARQVNEYPGINGLEVLTMGSRGGTSEAEGMLLAASLLDLAGQLGTFIAYQRDGGAYTLVDSKGVAWPAVILVDFRPDGAIKPALNYGCVQAFRAAFLHVL
jgi:hypothetical protein